MTLVELAKAGDRASRDQLTLEFVEAMRLYAERFCRSMRLDADDLMQEAVLLLPDWIEKHDPSKKSWAWFAEMKFKWFCRDFARNRINHPTCSFVHRSGRQSLTSSSIDAHDEKGNPFVRLPDNTRPEQLSDFGFLELIDLLKPRTRELFDLLYRHGLTMKSVGRYLGLSESRVSQIHSDTLEHLRRVLSDENTPTANGRGEKHQTVAHGRP